MKMYDYLVAYNFNAVTPSTGTMQISRKKKINTFEELASVRDFVAQHIPEAKNLSIYNFVLLGRNKH